MDNYYYIDIGVNFADKKYTQQSVVNILDNFYENYGESVISISNYVNEIETNRNLSNSDTKCKLYYTAGCHPHNAKQMKHKSQYDLIENELENKKCLCVGEIGLDFNRNFSPQNVQIKVFENQIQIAKKLNKPMYIHCRDAFDELIVSLTKFNYYNGVIHCFTGNAYQANKFVKLGFKLGITGWLLDKRRNADLVEAVKEISIEALMVETDAPFMALKKQKQSIPNNVEVIINEIAHLKNMDKYECGKIIYNTTKKFFNI